MNSILIVGLSLILRHTLSLMEPARAQFVSLYYMG